MRQNDRNKGYSPLKPTKTKTVGYGTNHCIATSRYRTGYITGPTPLSGQVVNPNNPIVTSDPTVQLAGIYQYFRIKSAVIRFLPIIGMTQNAVVTGSFLYDAEAIRNYTYATEATRREMIRNDGTARAMSVFNSPIFTFSNAKTSGRRWWRTDYDVADSVTAYEQTFPALFAATFDSAVDAPLGYLEFTVTYEFKDLFYRAGTDAPTTGPTLKTVSGGSLPDWPPGRGPDDPPLPSPTPPEEPKPPGKPPGKPSSDEPLDE